MKKIGIEKIICIVLIVIIIVEAIYIFIKSYSDNRSTFFLCAEAYSCDCGKNRELEMCNCKYCAESGNNDKCLEEKYVQCSNPELEENYE